LIYLVLLILLFAIYTSWRVDKIAGFFGEAIDKLNEEIKDLKSLINTPVASLLPEELSTAQWSGRPSNQEERHPLENPNPLDGPDAYTQALIMSEIDARPDAVERVNFLATLRRAGTSFSLELVGRLLKDDSPKVRAWVAANVSTHFKDYTDFDNSVVLADYEDQIRSDPDPLVRASLWRNTDCQQLPWTMMRLAEGWQGQLKGMTQLERLCLMRNPDLSFKYLVALIDADTTQLGITRKEHADMIYAGVINPRVLWSSRHHGRDYWVAFGDPNSPFEEFGEMWQLSLERWMDLPFVPYSILRFVQTTQEVKLAIYEKLLKWPEDAGPQQFREVIIKGCDPFTDRDLLKVAWDDPDKECREAARERVGRLTKFVGVSDKPKKP
jgi:hypothetical protein